MLRKRYGGRIDLVMGEVLDEGGTLPLSAIEITQSEPGKGSIKEWESVQKGDNKDE